VNGNYTLGRILGFILGMFVMVCIMAAMLAPLAFSAAIVYVCIKGAWLVFKTVAGSSW
jgi:hypothetical protein